jgi:hypothetical protein
LIIVLNVIEKCFLFAPIADKVENGFVILCRRLLDEKISNEVELAVDGGGMSGFEACMFGTAKLKEFGIE